jgi:hypothetical protein
MLQLTFFFTQFSKIKLLLNFQGKPGQYLPGKIDIYALTTKCYLLARQQTKKVCNDNM